MSVAMLGALPALASAQDTGGGVSAPAPATPTDAAPTSGADDMGLRMPAHAMRGKPVRISGHSRRAKKRVVRIERREAGGTWLAIGSVRASKKGDWTIVWKPRSTGAYELRARLGRATSSGDGGTTVGGTTEVGSASTRYLTVFEPAIATWYGPGFFGNKTACDIELTRETVGVAHRELPCGTQVLIAYKGRSIIVPVIDRGPFANNADWDLTQAAAEQVGMTATSRIGFIPLTPGG
jgi:hypothetical protein